MTQTHIGWGLIFAGLAVLLTSIAPELSALTDWNAATSPAFIGKLVGHLGGAIAMAKGGQYLAQPGR